MDVLLCTDLFKMYLEANQKQFFKDEKQKVIISIIENNNIRIVLNKCIEDAIEKKILQNPKLEALYHAFRTQLVSIGKIVNIDSFESTDKEDVLLQRSIDSYNNYEIAKKSKIFIPFSKCRYSFFTCILDEYNCPNINWFGYKLASCSPDIVCIRHFHLRSNEEIKALLSFIFQINNQISYIEIFDKNLNLKDNVIFETIKKNGHKIHYYTQNKGQANNQINNRELTKFFGALNMFVTKPNIKIHERRIIINEIIIDLDEDFWNVTKSRDTWFINFTYCGKIKEEYSKRGSNDFDRHLNR